MLKLLHANDSNLHNTACRIYKKHGEVKLFLYAIWYEAVQRATRTHVRSQEFNIPFILSINYDLVTGERSPDIHRFATLAMLSGDIIILLIV